MRVDQIPHAAAARQAAAPAPDLVLTLQYARPDGCSNELAAIQRVPASLLPYTRDREALHLTIDEPRNEIPESDAIERLQIQVLEPPVLPQRDDRVGRRLRRAHGEHHSQGARDRQLMHECRRRVVKQMSVVHDQHRGALAGGLEHGAAREHHHREPIEAGRIERRQQVGEGTKRDAGGRTGPGDPYSAIRFGGRSNRLARQAGLPHPGVARHHDPARVRRAQRALDQAELLLPPHQPDRVHTGPLSARLADRPLSTRARALRQE